MQSNKQFHRSKGNQTDHAFRSSANPAQLVFRNTVVGAEHGQTHETFVSTSLASLTELRSKAEKADLIGTWNIILRHDYGKEDITELPEARRQEFLQVITLLLAASSRAQKNAPAPSGTLLS